jgi:hypothetical protein
MENLKEGDWIKLKYTGHHCHGYDIKKDWVKVKIILWNSDKCIDSDNSISNKSVGGKSRWNSFITEDGKPILFGYYGWEEYIIEKIEEVINYEIY